jgi:hypothetical protein
MVSFKQTTQVLTVCVNASDAPATGTAPHHNGNAALLLIHEWHMPDKRMQVVMQGPTRV